MAKTASLYDNFCKTGNDVIYDIIIWVQDGNCNKSSAVAEMGDRGHNRNVPKRVGVVLCPFRVALGTRLTQCGLR